MIAFLRDEQLLSEQRIARKARLCVPAFAPISSIARRGSGVPVREASDLRRLVAAKQVDLAVNERTDVSLDTLDSHCER